MSKISDEHLRPHLTALVDGELEPLEAIALQQRLRQSPGLTEECRELERLKMAVHLAGTRERAPEPLKRQLEAMCIKHFAREARVRAQLRWVSWGAPLGLAASVIIAVVTLNGASREDAGTAERVEDATAATPERVEVARSPVDTRGGLLARLAAFHRDRGSPMTLRDLTTAGLLVTVERLPDSFIVPEGQRPQLVQASYMGCHEREGGSTLAVLDARRVDLPTRIDNALETTGVYVDSMDGVAVRLSVSGDKVFVLLSSEGASSDGGPI